MSDAGNGGEETEVNGQTENAAIGCGHVWDTSLHRGCPRCAIAAFEGYLKRNHERWERVWRESEVAGYDSGNTVVAAIAREAIGDYRLVSAAYRRE